VSETLKTILSSTVLAAIIGGLMTIAITLINKGNKAKKTAPITANPPIIVSSAAGPQLTKWERSEIEAIISAAKEELFFSGTTLARLIPIRRKIFALPDKIRIRLLAENVDDKTILESHTATFGRRPGVFSLEPLTNFERKTNIEIRTAKHLIPLVISAKDMNTSAGDIHVAFPSYGESGDSACVALTPNDADWYDFYKNQIELLWEQGIPWQP